MNDLNKNLIRVFLFICFVNTQIKGVAQPGKDGNFTTNISGSTINTYSPLATSAFIGASSIVANIANLSNFSGPLSTGDLLLIIGIQGADMDITNTINYGSINNYNSAGSFEFVYVQCLSGTSTIGLQSPLVNNYTVGGRNRIQVVRVPLFDTLTVNAGASIVPGNEWNGTTGGIVAFHSLHKTINNGTISADSSGFRGGQTSTNSSVLLGTTDYVSTNLSMGGEKGESIVGNQTDYDLLGGRFCRGAAANGGGGGTAVNTGGGGGANGSNGFIWNGKGIPSLVGGANWITAWNLESTGFSANTTSGGGRGGYSWNSNSNDPLIFSPGIAGWGGDQRRSVGGLGGRSLSINPNNKVFFGGGGGCGEANDGCSSNAGDGGGIIFILGGDILGNGIISANGQDGGSTVSPNFDGGSGAGGGGSVVLKSNCFSSQLVRANGGNGGDMLYTGIGAHGPGGGGGGGYVAMLTGSLPIPQINGGVGGEASTAIFATFPPNGATDGALGQIGVSDTNFATWNLSLPIVIGIASPSTICVGETTVLTGSGANVYSWSGGVMDGVGFSPLTTSTYTVTGTTAAGCTNTATVTVQVNTNPAISIIATPPSVCMGQPTTFTASGANVYSWSGGITNGVSFIPLSTSTYTVIGTDANGCSNTSSVTIVVGNDLNINITPSNPLICLGDSIQLVASGASFYDWQPNTSINATNISNPYVYPGQTTTYFVTGTDANGCTGTASITIEVIADPYLTISKSNDVDCNINTVQLTASGASSYSWQPAAFLSSPNAAVTNATISMNTTFVVTGTIGTCILTDSIEVNVYHSDESSLYIPTAFTPNEDGNNDCFRIASRGLYSNYYFAIYNRWGQKVFETNNTKDCWNGQFNNKKVELGTYYYFLRADSKCGKIFRKGDITVLY